MPYNEFVYDFIKDSLDVLQNAIRTLPAIYYWLFRPFEFGALGEIRPIYLMLGGGILTYIIYRVTAWVVDILP